MVTNVQTTLYRKKVSSLLQSYRNALFVESGRVVYPTDSSIASRLGISPTALSSISRQCSSMSALTLRRLLIDLSCMLTKSDFSDLVTNFLAPE